MSLVIVCCFLISWTVSMLKGCVALSSFRQENKGFVSALKTLEKDPVCQRQSLKSFLVLPFQRITRLKLLMEVNHQADSDTRFVF